MRKNRIAMYIIVGIISLLIILLITGRKSVHSEMVINSSQEEVWDILIDMGKYDQWNPVMKLIEGKVEEGNTVTYQFTQDENTVSNISAKVIEIRPNVLLNQKGGIPLILTFNHRYSLEQVENQTKVVIHEDYRGIGVNFWNPTPVGDAYDKINEALKNRAEE